MLQGLPYVCNATGGVGPRWFFNGTHLLLRVVNSYHYTSHYFRVCYDAYNAMRTVFFFKCKFENVNSFFIFLFIFVFGWRSTWRTASRISM